MKVFYILLFLLISGTPNLAYALECAAFDTVIALCENETCNEGFKYEASNSYSCEGPENYQFIPLTTEDIIEIEKARKDANLLSFFRYLCI